MGYEHIPTLMGGGQCGGVVNRKSIEGQVRLNCYWRTLCEPAILGRKLFDKSVGGALRTTGIRTISFP